MIPNRAKVSNNHDNVDNQSCIEKILPPFDDTDNFMEPVRNNNQTNINNNAVDLSKTFQAISGGIQLEEHNDMSSFYSNNYCSAMSTEDASELFNSLI